MKQKIACITAALLLAASWMTGCQEGSRALDYPVTEKPAYMIYYGAVNDRVVENAKQYDIAILHPRQGYLTREQVAEIQSAGTKVLGYIAVGEDLRTANLTPEEMRGDPRFTGDGSGPRVDPREEGDTSLEHIAVSGSASPGGTGFASYYLDDNDHDGRPDMNPYFTCAYTNIGDPAWYKVLDEMTVDGEDGVPGIREILSMDYGRGLGCDGLFLDTVDTCAPNSYTTDDDVGRTRFEWTAVGVKDFMARIKAEYPDVLLCQNRGLFFYNHLLAHYRWNPRESVDYLFFESYRLDSSPAQLFHEGFFADNKYHLVPRLAVESRREDGFTVLSLGYAEGPETYDLKGALVSGSDLDAAILREDIVEAEDIAGFSHYITNSQLTAINDFVANHRTQEDTQPPVWSSVYNHSEAWPPHAPEPRVGVCAVEALQENAKLYWDVALDKTGVVYTLYYQDKPFDFAADPDLTKAQKIILKPEVTEEYEQGIADAYPYCAVVGGLTSGREYSFVIRAVDTSENHNEEKNTVFVTARIK